MASFVEQATLRVKDESTPQIARINAELKKLFATAKSLKSVRINIDVRAPGVSKAVADLTRLRSAVQGLRSARVNLSVNATGLSQAARQIQQLRTQAQRPITVNTAPSSRAATAAAVTRRGAAAVPAPMGRGGLGGSGVAYPRGPISVIGTVAVSNIGALGHAAARGTARAAQEGAVQADVADTALRLRQMPQHLQTASETAIAQIGEEQKDKAKTPSGQLFNRAQIAQLFAEALPVAKYDVAGAKALTEEMIELTKLGVAQGQSFQTARKGAIDYSKALEMQDVLFDSAGKFKPEAATKWFDTIRKVAPDIGEEMTGQFMRSAVKYARSSRYAMTPEALAGLLFTSEEMGPSSAGTAMNQALKNLSGVQVQKKQLANLKKFGLLDAEEVKAGSLGDKTIMELVGGKVNDPELQRQNMFQWLNQRAIPAMVKAGFDPQNKVDVGKFAGLIASDRTARDFIEGAINRSTELQKQIEIAMARPGDKATVGKTLAGSTRLGFESMQAQFQSVMGETLQGAGQILMPVMEGLSGHMQTFAKDIEAARKGDVGAQAKLTAQATAGTLGAVVLAPLAKSTMAMMGQLAAPMGIMAGVTGAATATSPAAQSLNLAGVSLNSAAQALTGAANNLGSLGGLIPFLKFGTAAAFGYSQLSGSDAPEEWEQAKAAGTLDQLYARDAARYNAKLAKDALDAFDAGKTKLPPEKSTGSPMRDAARDAQRATEHRARLQAEFDRLTAEATRLANAFTAATPAVKAASGTVVKALSDLEKRDLLEVPKTVTKQQAKDIWKSVGQPVFPTPGEMVPTPRARPPGKPEKPFYPPLPKPTKPVKFTDLFTGPPQVELPKEPPKSWADTVLKPPTPPKVDTLEVGSANRIVVPPPKTPAQKAAAAAGQVPAVIPPKTAEQKAREAGMAGTDAGEKETGKAAPTDIASQLAAAAPGIGAAMAAPLIAAGPTIGAGIGEQLSAASAVFASTFASVGSQLQQAGASLVAAGSTAASTIQAGASAAGSAYGAAAAAKIAAATANVTISVNHTGSGGGTGGSPGPVKEAG